jgi:hypothetical protein
MEEILVIGYFGHDNLGDEVFKWIFENIFPSLTSSTSTTDTTRITCVDADSLQLPLASTVCAVIVGGGDLINDYFMKKLKPLLQERKFRTCPIYAIGIGIPYEKLIAAGYLDGFDYIIHRSTEDEQYLLSRYGEAQVHLAPDLAWLLPDYARTRGIRVEDLLEPISSEQAPEEPLQKAKGLFGSDKPFRARKIAICLARPMFNARDPECYAKIVDGLATFLYSLAMETEVVKRRTCWVRKPEIIHMHKYILEFIPFSTGKVAEQNDCVMNRDVYKRMIDLLPNSYSLSEYPDGDVPYEETNNFNGRGPEGKGAATPLSNIVFNNGVEIGPDTIIAKFREFDFAICSRFHAHIFSLMTQVPFLSINSTRKVHTLVKHANMQDYEYSLPIHEEWMYPLECDSRELFIRFSALLRDEVEVREKLRIYYEDSIAETRKLVLRLKNLFFYLPGPRTQFMQRGMTAPLKPLSSSSEPLSDEEVSLILSPGGLKKWGLSPEDTTRFVRSISFLLTGTPDSEYSWGLQEQILSDTFDLTEACKWIFDHRLRESTSHRVQALPRWKAYNTIPRKLRTLQVEYIREFADYQGKHRSGWDYVMQHVQKLHNPRAPLIFDGYLDETFGWRHDTLVDVGKLPFVKPWMGILHHTSDQKFSNHNLVCLFARPTWKASLPYCHALVTLSSYLATWVRRELAHLGFPEISVHVIKHPTEGAEGTKGVEGAEGAELNTVAAATYAENFKFGLDTEVKRPSIGKFNLDNFLRQKHRAVVQVGGWLRNTFAIYELPNYISQYGYQKYALKGKGMDHYYLTREQFIEYYCKLQNALSHMMQESAPLSLVSPVEDIKRITCAPAPAGGSASANCSTVGGGAQIHISPWIIGAQDAILENLMEAYSSVKILQHVDNEHYDELLETSVVFLNLVDCSAVNTILECIVRNTPILVNPLPAVVEYLGEGYPLYYKTLEEAAQLLICDEALKSAHHYLTQMDKSDLTIAHFMKGVLTLPFKTPGPF